MIRTDRRGQNWKSWLNSMILVELHWNVKKQKSHWWTRDAAGNHLLSFEWTTVAAAAAHRGNEKQQKDFHDKICIRMEKYWNHGECSTTISDRCSRTMNLMEVSLESTRVSSKSLIAMISVGEIEHTHRVTLQTLKYHTHKRIRGKWKFNVWHFIFAHSRNWAELEISESLLITQQRRRTSKEFFLFISHFAFCAM